MPRRAQVSRADYVSAAFEISARSGMQSLTLKALGEHLGLDAIGNNLLLQTPASGQPSVSTPGKPGYGSLLQGFLESSNVNVVSEITDLISAQRAYEMNSKVIKTADEMASTINQMS